MVVTVQKFGRFGKFTSDVNPKLEAMLYKQLAYTRKNAHFYTNPLWAIVHFYQRKKKIFPWGLIQDVTNILEAWKQYSQEDYTIKSDSRLQFNKQKWDTVIAEPMMRQYQIEAIMSLIDNNGGLVAIPTGTGKTFIAKYFLQSVDYNKVLILVPSRDLKFQWELENITDSNVQTVQYLMRHTELLKQYDIIIFDEVHHVASKTLYQLAMNCGGSTVIGLTATPYRADGDDMKITAAMGKIVYQKDIKWMTENKYLVQPRIIFKDVARQTVEPWDDYNDIYNNCVVNNPDYNEQIYDIVKIAPKPCLILVDKLEHGENLKNIIPCSIFVNGNSKDRKQIFTDVNDGKHDKIIATKVYGEGVNIPRLRSLVLAGGGKSCVKLIQNIGRVLRLFEDKTHAVIYDFIRHEKYLQQHYNERCDVYEREDFTIER